MPKKMPKKSTPSGVTPWLKAGAGLLSRVTSTITSGATRRLTESTKRPTEIMRRQTDIMKKTAAVAISAADLRARVNDLAERLASRLEQTADQISAETSDSAVRRRALAFKVDAIPAVYTAAYRVDPLVAAVDAWGLCFQIKEYVETGAGRNAFGPQQSLAQAEARHLLGDADACMQGFTTSTKAFDVARTKTESWAAIHPIEYAFSSRSSVAPVMAEWRSEDRNAFLAVGEITDTVQNLSEHLNTYAAQLPRQIRWQAELLVAEMANEQSVARLVASAGTTVRELVAAERQAVLANVDELRRQTLDYLTAERLATLAALRQERIDVLTEVDALQRRVVDTVLARSRGLVDYALWRAALLLTLLAFSATTIGVVVYRLTAPLAG